MGRMPAAMNSLHLGRALPAFFISALVIVTFLMYREVRLAGFVWDTVPFVLENPWIMHPSFDDFMSMFVSHHRANWQPMVWLSHSLDFAIFGDDPGLHHLANVAYHTVDGCLMYFLVPRLLRPTSLTGRETRVVAFLTALAFLIHPQHVQSVAWIVERKDTLYVLFTLLCFISYLRRHQEGGARRDSVFTFVLFLLALMAKPMAVTIPAVMVLLDMYPLQRGAGIRDLPRLVIEKWPFWVFSIFVIIVTLYTQRNAMSGLDRLPLWERPITAANNALFYIYGYLVPINLSPFYPFPQQASAILAPGYWAPGAFFLLAITATGIWFWRRGVRFPLLMEAFYLITLAPVSGLIAVGPAKALDYYSYLATAPLGLLIALAIVTGYRRLPKVRSVVVALTVAWVLALWLIGFQQVRIWRNDLTLWTRAYQLYPRSGYVNRNLSGTYLAMDDIEHALFHAKESARYSPAGKEYLKQLNAALAERQRQQPR